MQNVDWVRPLNEEEGEGFTHGFPQNLSHRPKPYSPGTIKMDASSERYSFKPVQRWNPQVEDYFIKAYGSLHFAQISKGLTPPSCYSCIRVNTLKSTSDAVIEKLQEIMRKSG
ncbi:hypothetical protein CRYUN_Cryun23aG0032300 [Craigia yunnanensis]